MDIPLDLKLFMNNTAHKIYKCEQCNASYSDKSYFELHKHTHQKPGENGGEDEGGGEELPTTIQIAMPAPAHQSDQHTHTELHQDQQQQLTAFKRAYGGELHQIYEIAPSTRYQVVGSVGGATPHVLTAVSLSSLPVQVTGAVTGQVTSLPAYTTTPTYVLAEHPDAVQPTHTQPRSTPPTTITNTTTVPVTIHHHEQHQHQQHHQQQQQQQQHHHQEQQQQQATVVTQHHPQQVTVQQQQVAIQQQQQQQVSLPIQQTTQPNIQTQLQPQPQRLVIALEAKDRPYKCDQCTASFIEAGELTDHKKKHSGDGPFTCEDCHFTFMYKSHFRSHKTRCLKKRALMPNHPKPIINPGPIKRQFPTHTSNTNTQTNTHHVKTHSTPTQQVIQPPTTQQHHTPAPTRNVSNRTGGQGAKQGGVGGGMASFNPSNPTFKRQKKEQRLDRPYECSECDASFQTAQDLQTHKAKHTGEGPFKCEECRFVFLYRKLYDAHRRRCEKKRKELGLASHTQPQTQTIQQQEQHPQQQQQQQVTAAPTQTQVVQTVSGQQVQLHNNRGTATATLASPTTVQLSGPIQIHTTPVPGHPQTAVIDMRSVQGVAGAQGQSVQTLQHPTLIEQVIHVTPVSTTLPGGRQEIKYDIVHNSVDVADVNQIMNLIKVKGHQQ